MGGRLVSTSFRSLSMRRLQSAAELATPNAAVVDYSSPIRSLDQLYAQAAGMDVILRRKVKGWARRSNGSFQLDNGGRMPEFARWADVCATLEYKRRIKWGRLKNVSRSVEKLFRSYGEDVSRLVDVCRQSIVFDSVGNMITCVRAIAADPEIQVVRTKNRLDPAFDSSRTAGYRDVSINVRILNKDTVRLCLAAHVCEVLLLMKPFAELKHEEGHKRYIQFRNARGE